MISLIAIIDLLRIQVKHDIRSEDRHPLHRLSHPLVLHVGFAIPVQDVVLFLVR